MKDTGKSKGDITRERIIRTALELVHTNGFNRTSLSAIMAAAGVQKGNLYFHFDSKEALGLAVIETARDNYFTYLKRHIRHPDPLEKIKELMDAVFTLHCRRNFVGGCIFGNIALEMGDLNPAFAGRIIAIFQELKQMLAEYIQAAQRNGTIRSEPTADRLAGHVLAAMEGSIMMAKLNKSEAELQNCLQMVQYLLTVGGCSAGGTSGRPDAS